MPASQPHQLNRSKNSTLVQDSQTGVKSFDHFAQIVSAPQDEYPRPVLAAGAALWRFDPTAKLSSKQKGSKKHTPDTSDTSDIQVAVVHRPNYDDWSLPKGKLDPGENLHITAERETWEETGYRSQLGWLLGSVHYYLKSGKDKVVFYWTSQVTSGKFVPNNEVDELRWLSFKEAKKLVSYDYDRTVLERARQLLELGETRRILLTRHAKAVSREDWSGSDSARPLLSEGYAQAEGLIQELAPYSPEELISAEPLRCVGTLAPLAHSTGLPLHISELIGDHENLKHPESASKSILNAPGVGVSSLCSQGDEIELAINQLLAPRKVFLAHAEYKKAGTWVLHLRGDDLIGLDYCASPLPLSAKK